MRTPTHTTTLTRAAAQPAAGATRIAAAGGPSLRTSPCTPTAPPASQAARGRGGRRRRSRWSCSRPSRSSMPAHTGYGSSARSQKNMPWQSNEHGGSGAATEKGAQLPEEVGQHDPRRQRHGRPRRLQQRAPSATAVRNEELWAAVKATATTTAEGKGLLMVMEASARVLKASGLL